MFCPPVPQNSRRPASGTRCRCFDTVQAGPPAQQHPSRCATSSRPPSSDTLPAVSWIVPVGNGQRAPARAHHRGQAYVTGLINAVMRSATGTRPRSSSAWDDWGGFYDHVDAARRRRERLRPARPGARDLPLRQAGLHRPPDPELRRLPEVHRRRLPRRPAHSTRSTDGRPDPRPTCARTRRSSATSPTSTSTRNRDGRSSSRSTRPTAEMRAAAAHVAAEKRKRALALL